MARHILEHRVHPPQTTAAPSGHVVDLLDATREHLLAPVRADVDHLLELRGLIRCATEQERAMTAAILHAMGAAGVDHLAGLAAVAIRDTRTSLNPDVGLFVEALGPRAYDALTVNVTPARRLMGADDLVAISETIVSSVLRVEPLEGGQ